MNHALLYIEDDEQNIALVEAVLRTPPSGRVARGNERP
jgi:hypothetical protein